MHGQGRGGCQSACQCQRESRSRDQCRLTPQGLHNACRRGRGGSQSALLSLIFFSHVMFFLPERARRRPPTSPPNPRCTQSPEQEPQQKTTHHLNRLHQRQPAPCPLRWEKCLMKGAPMSERRGAAEGRRELMPDGRSETARRNWRRRNRARTGKV